MARFSATTATAKQPSHCPCDHRYAVALAQVAIIIGCLAVPAPAADRVERPNIVLIMADDLGYGDLSCYGGWIETPHLDALAQSGVRLTDFHSSGNVCSPTRAGLMTGRYQQRAGIAGVVFADPRRDAHYHGLQPQERTFAELLADSGYQTAIFGKWHLGYLPQYNPIKHGFQTFRGYVSGNIDFFSHIDQAGNADWWRQDRLNNEAGYTTHLITEHAIDFIHANRDRPFCLYLPHEAPHAPYQGPDDRPLRTVGNGSIKQQEASEVRRAYREMVQAMDEGVGRIVSSLQELDLERKTLVMFLSDNGANPRGNNGPLRGHKGSDWEGGHRVPMIAAWPGTLPAGKTSDALTISLDLMPTILEVAGVMPPEGRPLDGVSLMPVLRGEAPSQPRQLFWNGNAVRDGQWKLILSGRGSKSAELYDLATDLGEQTDLATAMPERVQRMRSALQHWQTDVDATATAQPDVRPPDSEPPHRDWDTAAFWQDNLVAWCIVPFDAANRTPAERAAMLRRLGITRVAYDWRQEHVEQFEEEIRQYLKHGLDYFAFWDWHPAIEPLIRKYDIRPQIWKTNPSPGLATDPENVAAAAEQLLPLVEKAQSLGCQFGLYNHGNWGGQPDHLIAVCQHLREKHDAQHVGIVYNFHHGHGDIDNFGAVFERLQPYLLCVNINGMVSAEQLASDGAASKILSVGRGDHEAAMLRVITESGYRGPIGIIGHRADRDVEDCLRENLDGLKEIADPAVAADAADWRQPPELLPNTQRLEWDDPLDVRLMDGAHRYIERQILHSVDRRPRFWSRDLSGPDAYQRSIAGNRDRFRAIIGAVNRGREVNHHIALPPPPLPVQMEWVSDGNVPAVLRQADDYRVVRVRWPVLKGVHGEGLLLEPVNQRLAGSIVVLPDADQQPEQLAGIAPGLPAQQQVARQLAENGFRVIVASLIDRGAVLEGDQQQTRREWIYRQAFHMGRHIIGYEVEKVQAAIDWLKKTAASGSVGVAGYGEGGLIAFYTAAVDPRVDAVLVSGYFGPRDQVWQEPIYRNVWSLLHEFGDAEIATLIAPRPMVIEYSEFPNVSQQKGELRTPPFAAVRKEAERIDQLTQDGFQVHELVSGADGAPTGPWSQPALQRFTRLLGQSKLQPPQAAPAGEDVQPHDEAQRQLRQVWELDDYTQWLVRDSDHVRNDFYLYKVLPEHKRPRWSTEGQHPTSSAEQFAERSKPYREHLWEEVLGKFHEPLLPMNPRSRRVADQDKWVAYDVVLDVLPDLIAWGILMVPKDLQAGEQRPVVVVQHGRNGLPQNIMNGGYNAVAARLLERGFIVFAPHNLYRGEDRYRWLDRKANSVKASLFSFIIAQHDQITQWLATLPFVDGGKIAFYGNSYGGETAVRVPPILERYALSICASDFNDWTRKVADTHDWHSFMNTIEWEMPYFNMGSTFSYAEMAYLMVPRPFMAERGHHDLVAPDQWVGYEFAKVRWLYDQLGLPERRHIEFFQGGHTMKGNETFDFLHQHLDWPTPAERQGRDDQARGASG